MNFKEEITGFLTRARRELEGLRRSLEALRIDLHNWLDRQADVIIRFLYDKGATWRNVDKAVTYGFGLLLVAFFTWAILPSLPSIFRTVKLSLLGLARLGYDELRVLGNLIGTDGVSFATYASAQIIADIISAAVIAVLVYIVGRGLLGRYRRGQNFPTHGLEIIEGYARDEDDGITSHAIKVSNKEGDEPAFGCRAQLNLEGLTWRDVVDVPNALYSHHSEEFAGTNYFKTTTLSLRLPWENGQFYQTILSGDSVFLEIFRLVPANGEIPEHFEVRCLVEHPTVHVELAVALRPLRQYGTLRIIPQRGRFRESSFSVSRIKRRTWQISV